MKKEQNNPSPRRKFIGSIAASAAALGLFSFKSPIVHIVNIQDLRNWRMMFVGCVTPRQKSVHR